jgi:inner membrane protein
VYLQFALRVSYYAAMDNLSHSVVGLAAGELIHRSLAAESDSVEHSTRRR